MFLNSIKVSSAPQLGISGSFQRTTLSGYGTNINKSSQTSKPASNRAVVLSCCYGFGGFMSDRPVCPTCLVFLVNAIFCLRIIQFATVLDDNFVLKLRSFQLIRFCQFATDFKISNSESRSEVSLQA